MDSQKKHYFKQLQKWNENLEIILEKENEYSAALKKKYQNVLDELKNQLRLYFNSNNFFVIEKSSFIEAKFGDGLLLIRVEFPEVSADIHYKFRLSIVEESRREFIIYIIPDSNGLYIPKLSNIRYRPQDSKQLNNSIGIMENEFFFLNDKIKEINLFTFYYCYHSAQKKQDRIEDLKNFDDFLTILIRLLSN